MFFLISAIYLYSTSPTVTSDDSGELAGVCTSLGTAHPSGYPLYTLLGKIFVELIPFGDNVYKVNFLSVFFACLTVIFIFLILIFLTENIFVSVISTLIFSFIPYFWFLGLITEVYTLNSFIIVLITYLILKIINTDITEFKMNYIFLIFLLFGFGLGNHYTLILFFPGFFYLLFMYIIRNNIEIKKTLLTIFISFIFFILGLCIYFYIYIRAFQNPIFSWEDPKTFVRFLGIILRKRYEGQIAYGPQPPLTLNMILQHLYFFITEINSGITIFGIILLCVGIYIGLSNKKFRTVSLFLLISIFFAGPFFLFLTRLNIDAQSKGLLERFMYLSFIPICIFLGFGIANLTKKYSAFIILFFLIPIFLFLKNYKNINRRYDFIYYDYGKNILRTLPENSMLFSDRADEMEFTIAYLTRIKKIRTDIEFTDCNAGVSKSIYGDNYYKIWGKPRLAIREIVEKNIINSTDKNVFYATFLPEQTNIEKFKYGILYNTKKTFKKFYFDYIYFLRPPLESDIRSKSLYYSHFQLLGDYFLYINEIEKAKKNFYYSAYLTKDNNILLKIPWWYFNNGDYIKAREEYKQLLKLYPQWYDVLLNLGVVEEKLTNLNEAINCYKKCISIKPDRPDAYYNLGVIYWYKNDFKNVVYYFEKVLELNPQHEQALKFLPLAKSKIK